MLTAFSKLYVVNSGRFAFALRSISATRACTRFPCSDGTTSTEVMPTASVATTSTSTDSQMASRRNGKMMAATEGTIRTSPLIGEAVPDAAHGLDVPRLAGLRVALLAQVAYVDVDRPRLAEVGRAPDAVEQLRAGEDAARARHQHLQEL